jgi:hypothetical protein
MKKTVTYNDKERTTLMKGNFILMMGLILVCSFCFVRIVSNYLMLDDYGKNTIFDDDNRIMNSENFENNNTLLLLSTHHISSATPPHLSTQQVTNTTQASKEAVVVEGIYNIPSIVDDFDLSVSRVNCGWGKCFIPSLSNRDIGYLVGRGSLRGRSPRSLLDNYIRTLEFSKWMDKEFDKGLHFYTDETPSVVELNSTEMKKLNDLVYSSNHKNKPNFYSRSRTPHVVIQSVKKAYTGDMFLFSCYNRDKHDARKKDYIKNNVIKNGNGEEFYYNLEYSYKIIKKLFHMKPEMVNDFQILVDNKGHIHFIDLDGQFTFAVKGIQEEHIEEHIINCLAKFEGFRNLTITQ